MPDEITLQYNAKDALAQRVSHDAFMGELVTKGLIATYDFTMSLYDPLMYMMTRGVRVDKEKLKSAKIKIEKEIEVLQTRIHELCGRDLNPNSPKDCIKYFYFEKNIPPYFKKNLKGESVMTCDDRALTRIARGGASRQGLYEAKLIQEWRTRKKLMGTYLEVMFDEDGRLRCQYKPRGSRFGRFSSAPTVFKTGLNMQNVPEVFRVFVVADDGKIFVARDLRQAEWIVVAYQTGDDNMLKVVEEGRDPHTYTAAGMYGAPEELIRLDHKLCGHSSDPEEIEELRSRHPDIGRYAKWLPRNRSMRQGGKKANHGLNYDETYKMFALDNEVTEQEAKRTVESYHSLYPGIRKNYERIKRQLGRDRTLVNPFGRSYTFKQPWGDPLFKAAYAFTPQSTVADVLNQGMRRVYHDCSDITDTWELMFQVHDELGTQEDVEGLSMEGLRYGRDLHLVPVHMNGRDFTIPVDTKIGFSWGQMTEVDVDKLADAELAVLKSEMKEAFYGNAQAK